MIALCVGGPLLALHPHPGPSCVLVPSISQDFWRLLTVIADTSWVSALALVSSVDSGAVGKIGCDGA